MQKVSPIHTTNNTIRSTDANDRLSLPYSIYIAQDQIYYSKRSADEAEDILVKKVESIKWKKC